MVWISQELFKRFLKTSLTAMLESRMLQLQINKGLEYHGHQCFDLYSVFPLGGDLQEN